ncbi:MAG TPA: peptidoglycan bridge formation glycyltransferase FemA/FemB family protein [Candidatus Dormibacteraeota bacterium]
MTPSSAEAVAIGVDPAEWDASVVALGSPPPLLQSWGFGEVQGGEGWTPERVMLPGGGRAQVLLQGAGPLRWAYAPRGPVPATTQAVEELASWARERGLSRIRVEPEAPPAFGEALRELGFRQAAAVQPRHTQIVSLGAEDEMLAGFKPKHRYNIRLAARRGVTVEEGVDAAEMQRQSRGTAQRQGIALLAESQYRRRIELMDWCRVYVARHQGEALAAIMVARFGGRAYYLYGGSIGQKMQLMPTYAVQWAAMRAAAENGCRDYDLWGVPPTPGDANHPWHGLWQFKNGFGGELVEYCGAWDLVLSPWASRVDGLATQARRVARRLRR